MEVDGFAPAHAAEPEPEPPALPPAKRLSVRPRYLSHGWNQPPGNLLTIYIEACERHKVPANSAVISQLQRRVRLMQAGPWQRVAPSGNEADALLGATGASAFNNKNNLGSPHSRLGAAAAAAGDPILGQQSSYLSAASATAAEALSRPQTALTLAATTQDLLDLVVGHVYPLTLSASLRPATANGTNGGAPASTSENHAATVSAAVIALAAGGPDGQALYAAHAVAAVCSLLDPRTPWESQLAAAGLAADTRVVTESDFHRLAEAAAAGLTTGELRQAVLEVLGRPVGHGTLDVEGLAGALFDYLDVCAEGFIPASELRCVVAAFSPSAAVDMYGLLSQHPQLGRPAAAPVAREEFVSVLAALAPGLVPAGSSAGRIRDKAEIIVNSLIDAKIREPFGYDFSRCYLGPRGLLPVLDALSSDSSFVSLSLAHCGLGCSSVERLVDWLAGHPALTSLDLTNNLIADRGGLALARLLQTNTRIVQLGIGNTMLLPPRSSRTHHDQLGPSPCEDAGPVLTALTANCAAHRSSPAEIVRALRQHGPELRAMCYSLLARPVSSSSNATRNNASAANGHGPAGGNGGSELMAADGRVPLSDLREALSEVTAEWGFTPDALEEVLSHERLLGTATAGRTADASGRLGVTYDELMHFLSSDDQVVRVSRAFRNHLAEAKQLFFRLAPEPATAAAVAPAGVAGPRTALSTVRQALVEAAAAPGSGWDVSEADLEAVLSPALLRQHWRAAATGYGGAPAAAPLGGVLTAAGLPVGADGLVVPEWRGTAAVAAAGAGFGAGAPGFGRADGEWAEEGAPVPAPVAQQGVAAAAAAADMLISWPELANTLLYLFNR
ncbi:hypothetical protein HYH02_002173 [Chlamydomonas schloesseri]|uniref:EF-hand domain-containing protein n=1 Tax=Chlamydomonas schloesseri TaxID=2026947 RepID=A0A836BAN7_9CHLO|nr:hypothetical protein HYH02_002173 [Chlamydomonas schloesseri]|eukprot:KAG2452827.1 hypothetical protein HYH02_002173 [Chlamydomonas schloesseri]